MYLSMVQFSQSIGHLSRIYLAVAVSVHSFIKFHSHRSPKGVKMQKKQSRQCINYEKVTLYKKTNITMSIRLMINCCKCHSSKLYTRYFICYRISSFGTCLSYYSTCCYMNDTHSHLLDSFAKYNQRQSVKLCVCAEKEELICKEHSRRTDQQQTCKQYKR